jgi:threonine dehydratase
MNAVLRLAERSDVPPALVTASAGNHGQALAHAARLLRIPLTVYVPDQAPAIKLRAIEGAGASLVLCPDYDTAERRAKEHGARGLAEYVSPYAHADVIAGAGTIGLEILEEEPSIDAIVAPVGGGGLISGLTIAVDGRAAVLGVEAAASTPFNSGIAAGRIVPIDVQPTLADGLAGNLDPSTVTFEIVRQRVARLTSVTEAEIRAAIAAVLANERVTTEGACAVGVAGLRSGRFDLNGRRVAVVLTGANIDPEKLTEVVDGSI